MITTTLITKLCIGCKKPFKTAWKPQLRCKPNCRRKDNRGKRNRKDNRNRNGRYQDRTGRNRAPRLPARFVGIDGEGINVNGEHKYVLLTVGKESLTNDGKHLTWKEIFPFLYDCFLSDPTAVYVGYYLGYDFTQWLRSLTENRAEALFTKRGIAQRKRAKSGKNPMPFPVHIGDESNEYQWEIDILGMKRFVIRKGIGFKPEKDSDNPNKWMYICDVGGFFQQSFVKTISEFPGLCTPEELSKIIHGKLKRSDAAFDDEMIAYNLLECDLLARVMPLLDEGFRSFGVCLSRKQWFGPGQAAQAWLRLINAPSAEDVREKVPAWARDAARQTFFGGWFDRFFIGHIPGTTYEYDINSAYPAAISKLPCLLHGHWSKGEGSVSPPRKGLLMVYGAAVGKDQWVGAMLHRTKDGKVLRPRQTEGWYWWHEIQAARKAGLIARFNCIRWVKYEGCKCKPPFQAIEKLYLKRLEVGKKTPQGKAYKLVYNSSYGKMAQSIGNPVYSNPIYASLITCGCRCKVLKAIATHPRKTKDLVKIATDGIYFRTEHPSLKLDEEKLGLWSLVKKQNLTVFMPGVYWDDASRERIAKAGKQEVEFKLKSRGVPARDLAANIVKIDKRFLEFKGKRWPSIKIKINFSMVTPKQAIDRKKWHTCGVTKSGEFKTISSNPHTKCASVRFVGDAWRTLPYQSWNDLVSVPYDKSFGEDFEDQQGERNLTPEGYVEDLWHEQLIG